MHVCEVKNVINFFALFRYMPPVTPSIWKNTRLADRFGAVCPQRPPDIGNRSEALLEFPRGRLLYLEKLLPLLANESEDCLYLNLYVPRTGKYFLNNLRGIRTNCFARLI